MKKIVLKNESCIGCGACVGIDSEHFDFSDEGYSVIKSQENLDSPMLSDAIDACPVAIISLEDISTDEVESTENNDIYSTECHCESCTCEDCHCETSEIDEEIVENDA